MSMLPPKELHTHCPHCRAPMPPSERFCGSCRQDRGAYLAGEAVSGLAFASVRWWILGVAILTSISTLVLYLGRGDVTQDYHGDIHPEQLGSILSNAILALCYFGLWLWSKKQPFAAAVIALVLFVAVQAWNLMVHPSLVAQGVVIKVLIVVGLFGAVRAGLQARRIRAEHARDHWFRST